MSVENNRDAHVSTSGRCPNRAARGTTRRRFVQGALACGMIAGLDFWRWPAWALKSPNQPAVLTTTITSGGAEQKTRSGMGNMPGMNMGDMPGMNMGDMPGMKMGTASPSATPTAAQHGMSGMKMKGMQGMDMGDDMSGMDMRKMPGMKTEPRPPASRGPLSMPFPQPGPQTNGMSAPTMAGKPTPQRYWHLPSRQQKISAAVLERISVSPQQSQKSRHLGEAIAGC